MAVVSQNTTLDTVAEYISDARTLLLDQISPYRYDDDSLLTALNVALLEARRLRADLFVFNDQNGRVPAYTTNDNTQVPIEQQFRLAILCGMCAHALARDQEDVQDDRARMFENEMSMILIGRMRYAPQPNGSG